MEGSGLMILIVLVAMLFCHIIDDYKLQGILASMKQKSWWESNAPDRLYRNDYLMALVEHAFSWTCSIHIPVLVYSICTQQHQPVYVYVVVFILNWVIHALVDNLKANAHEINLIQDQFIHIIQIVITWTVYLLLV